MFYDFRENVLCAAYWMWNLSLCLIALFYAGSLEAIFNKKNDI